MSRPFAPSQRFDDFTLSSADGMSDADEHPIDSDIAGLPFPLKSTLPSQHRYPHNQARASRPSLHGIWHNEAAGPDILQRDYPRQTEEDDATLSTDLGTAADEYVGGNAAGGRTKTLYEDSSSVPGVGRGHQRAAGVGGASNSAHRDLLNSSHFAMHPSPSTAARHSKLRATTARSGEQEKRLLGRLPPVSMSDGEDSESGNDTSSTSGTSFIMQRQDFQHSIGESTGNHRAFEAVSPQRQSPSRARAERPKLDSRALDEMDRAMKKGKTMLRQGVTVSPASNSNRRAAKNKSELLYRKEEQQQRYQHLAQGSPLRSQRGPRQHDLPVAATDAEGSNGSSGYVAGTTARKPSDGSSNGRKQAGTAGSTSGDTLVDGRGRDYLHLAAAKLHRGEKPPSMKLPSGQRMGAGVTPESAVFLPDMTGMSAALESPVKTILGVEHRQMGAETIQARHIQLGEARLQEFNELAHYVNTVEKELDHTQKKMQVVEETSVRCAKEIGALRDEWSSWRESRERSPQAPDETEDAMEFNEGEEYDGKVKAINEHIAQLNRDLLSYRRTMEQMRAEKEEKEHARLSKAREKQRRQAERRRLAMRQEAELPLSSSPMKPGQLDEDDELTQLEMVALRTQVNKVAQEVERLRKIVDGADADRQESVGTKSARFASSLPPMRRSVGVGTKSPFAKQKPSAKRSSSLEDNRRVALVGSSIHVRSSSPPPSLRGFSDVSRLGSDHPQDGDETLRPSHPPKRGGDDEDEDGDDIDDEAAVTVLAQSRAEKMFEAVEERIWEHDQESCTVCRSKQKSERRRDARRERVGQQSRHGRDFADEEEAEEENILLSLLDALPVNQDSDISNLASSKRQSDIVQRLLQQHVDEFHHHRMLYCELADELKQFTPDMNRVKRRILAEHVMEAVEGLEFRARRINLLQALHGRKRSSLGHSHPNPQGRMEKDQRRPRNSPPIVDGAELFRRVVSG